MEYSNIQLVEKNIKIENLIGRGSTANVYQVVDTSSNQQLAIQTFTNKVRKLKAKNIFQIEKDMMTGLDHPNICQLKGAFNGLFLSLKDELIVADSLILELSDDGCLSKAVKDKRLSIKDKISIASQLFSAIEYIHEKDMAHNDIKLDNVTLAKECQAKLIDFSSATKKGYMEEQKLGVLGTNGYMAPELLDATDFSTIDRQKCDIYSLGVFVMHLFFEKLPYLKPNEFDFFYSEIISGNFDVFWEKQSENLEILKGDKGFNVEQFKKLINLMICFNPKQRKPVAELIKSDFFNVVKN